MSVTQSRECLLGDLHIIQQFFERSIGALTEEDSGYQPTPDTMTVAQQVAHVAQTIDWFVDAVHSPNGFDMNFEHHIQTTNAVPSLEAAKEWLRRSFANAAKVFGEASEEVLSTPNPADTMIMKGAPRAMYVGAIKDHTAHHRGALTVYARLLGKVPPMPYM